MDPHTDEIATTGSPADPAHEMSPFLVDLSNISLTALDEVEDGPLKRCLRRVLVELGEKTNVVAGFQSTI